jgi:E3 ubiquitin-protein ligase TRIP12
MELRVRVSQFYKGEYLTSILQPGGRDLQVTSTNVNEYVLEVIDAIIGKGASLQAQTFREGFSKVFPIQDLQAFSADELMLLFGNSDEDWNNESAQLFLLAKGTII